MDPEKLVEELLEEVRESRDRNLRDEELADHARSLADKIENLVSWLAKGGYQPNWKLAFGYHEALERRS